MANREDQSFEPALSNSEFASTPSATVGGFGDDDPFRRVLQFLKKRAWIVGVTLAMGLLAAILVNHFSQKLYTARATIEVQSEDMSSQFRLEQMQALGGSEDTSEHLDTEMRLMLEREIANAGFQLFEAIVSDDQGLTIETFEPVAA